MKTRAPGAMPSLSEIVEYWKGAAPEVFPNILAAHSGWDDPFCFHCGWWPPLPEDYEGNQWAIANGWLERAHLLDKSAGGPNEPFNLVPLCPLCHHTMPEFRRDIPPALDWVRAGQPRSCLGMYQYYTFLRWSGDRRHLYPGRRELLSAYMVAACRVEREARFAGVAA